MMDVRSNYTINYNRRFLIKALFAVTFLKTTLSKFGLGKHGEFTVSWISHPKEKSSERRFSSVDAFWSHHRDPLAYRLNAFFRENGWLIQDGSSFTGDGTKVILTKKYANEYYYKLYNSIWRLLSKDDPIEDRTLAFVPTNKHLF